MRFWSVALPSTRRVSKRRRQSDLPGASGLDSWSSSLVREAGYASRHLGVSVCLHPFSSSLNTSLLPFVLEAAIQPIAVSQFIAIPHAQSCQAVEIIVKRKGVVVQTLSLNIRKLANRSTSAYGRLEGGLYGYQHYYIRVCDCSASGRRSDCLQEGPVSRFGTADR